jgi:hypothetical protein
MGWIKIEDKKPKPLKRVLILTTDGAIHIATRRPPYTDYYWDADECGFRKEQVKYWAKIPKDPR